jgi:hypothetical protein
VLATLITYANWAAFQGNNYQVGGYLSPLYSPLITWPGMPFSPAFLILLPPVLFRATCYYYRKAYYRSYFLDPPACAVGDLRGKGYRGETAFPLVLQNLHRYLFYITFARVPLLPVGRRLPRDQVRRPLRYRRRDARHPRQHRRAHPVQLLLPFRPASGRRKARLLLVQRRDPLTPQGVARRELPERAAALLSGRG